MRLPVAILTTALAMSGIGLGQGMAEGRTLPAHDIRDQIERGAERYQAMCARCHGHDLLTKYAEVPSLTGYAFDRHWRGRLVGELYDRIRVTMPAMGPRLDPQLSADLTAYILAFNDAAPEGRALPAEEDVLYALEIPKLD